LKVKGTHYWGVGETKFPDLVEGVGWVGGGLLGQLMGQGS